jgi:protein TonB
MSEPDVTEPLPQLKEIPKKSSPVPVAAPVAASVEVAAPVPNFPQGDGRSPEPGRDKITARADIGARAHPAYKRNPEPMYPVSARRRGQQGTVLLAVRVSADGRALDVKVRQSSGYALLDEAATAAVRDWEFEPARVNARSVKSEIEVPVQFKLTE